MLIYIIAYITIALANFHKGSNARNAGFLPKGKIYSQERNMPELPILTKENINQSTHGASPGYVAA